MATLLERAKKIKSSRAYTGPYLNPTNDQVELAIAWLGNEITGKQFMSALDEEKTSGADPYVKGCVILKNAIKNGLLTMKIN